MNSIEKIDVNFKTDIIKADDIAFYDCLSAPFEIRGLYKPQELKRFLRLPPQFETDERVNDGIHRLMFYTAGGRVRFVTNSPYIAISTDVVYEGLMPQMAASGHYGFDLYAADINNRTSNVYKKTFSPNGLTEENGKYDGFYEFSDTNLREITINFPLYCGVKSLYIGLSENAKIEKPQPYTIEKPIFFYGSSVTQGGCASRPGMTYTAILSRWLDSDYINLGCSGSDRGEEALAQYISNVQMSAFIFAYGYNAPSVWHYEKTYYPFYKIIRDKNPKLPIFMMSSPVCLDIKNEKDIYIQKREVVLKAYERARSEGDRNIYFIDGFTLLQSSDATVDTTHPSDLGFYNMAEEIYPILKNVLSKGEIYNENIR